MSAPLRSTLGRLLIASGLALVVAGAAVEGAGASDPQIDAALANARPFAVLAGSTATNTGPSVINGDVGVSPGSATPGFGTAVVNGTFHNADSIANSAQTNAQAAYNIAAARPTTVSVGADLGGSTLVGGVYTAATSLGLTGTLTLDGGGNAASVWIFQAGSTLTTASASRVLLINGADPCNVYWQIGSSATLGSGSAFVGTILADQSIHVAAAVTVRGRLLADVADVTLINDTITVPRCAPIVTTTTTTRATTTTTIPTTTTSTVPATTTSTNGATTTTAIAGTTSTTRSLAATTTTSGSFVAPRVTISPTRPRSGIGTSAGTTTPTSPRRIATTTTEPTGRTTRTGRTTTDGRTTTTGTITRLPLTGGPGARLLLAGTATFLAGLCLVLAGRFSGPVGLHHR